MGNRPSGSQRSSKEAAFVPPGMDLLAGNDGKVYMVKQYRAGCTKCTMWRADPRTNSLHSEAHFPRDGAVVRGTPIDHPKTGEPWLIATHVAQNGGRGGWNYAPVGAALPFQNKQFMLKEVGVTL